MGGGLGLILYLSQFNELVSLNFSMELIARAIYDDRNK